MAMETLAMSYERIRVHKDQRKLFPLLGYLEKRLED